MMWSVVRTNRGVYPLFLLLRTFVCVVFCVSVCGGYMEQKFAMEPQDQVR